VCCYTTSWDVRWRTQAGDATDQLRDPRWSSLACGPQTTLTQIRSIMWFGIFFNRWPVSVDDLRQSTSWSRWLSLSGANCRSFWLIAPLVSGVAGLRASSSSKANTLNIWCENCEMWFLENNWDNKHVVSVVNFLKYVLTKVVLFLIVILKTLTSQGSVVTHFRGGGIYSDSFIAHCLLILTVKKFWKSVDIWWSYEAYKNGAIFGPPCTRKKKKIGWWKSC